MRFAATQPSAACQQGQGSVGNVTALRVDDNVADIRRSLSQGG
jgi:hypothetical protein